MQDSAVLREKDNFNISSQVSSSTGCISQRIKQDINCYTMLFVKVVTTCYLASILFRHTVRRIIFFFVANKLLLVCSIFIGR
jgi:hypothetical protein